MKPWPAITIATVMILIPFTYFAGNKILDTSTNSPPSIDHPGLELRVGAPAQAQLGNPIDLRLFVVNVSGSTLNLSGGDPNEAYEFYAYDGAGHEVWRSLFGYALSAVLAHWSIASYDNVTHVATWSGTGNDGQPVPPGNYTIKGRIFLSSDDSPESSPVTLTLTSPQS